MEQVEWESVTTDETGRDPLLTKDRTRDHIDDTTLVDAG